MFRSEMVNERLVVEELGEAVVFFADDERVEKAVDRQENISLYL